MHCLLLWQLRVDFLRVNWENKIRSLIRNRNKSLILVSQILNLYNFGLMFLYITLFTYYRFRSPIFDIAKVLNSAIRINHTRINACATITNWPNIPFWMKSRFITNDLEKKGQLHHLQGKLCLQIPNFLLFASELTYYLRWDHILLSKFTRL